MAMTWASRIEFALIGGVALIGLIAQITRLATPLSPDMPMLPQVDARPKPDLLRLDFPRTGWVVEEQTAEKVEVADGRSIISISRIDSEGVSNVQDAWRGMLARESSSRVDKLERPGSPVIYRLLRGVTGPSRGGQAQYLVMFADGSWINPVAIPRAIEDATDFAPFDEFFLSLRLAEHPDPTREVHPAWEAYQSARRPGTPLAKFELYMDPAPILIGAVSASEPDPYLSEEDSRRGGRQHNPTLFEFYAEGDPTSVRVDFWAESPPAQPDREPVYRATLRVDHPRVEICSFTTTLCASIDPGEYDVIVTLVHRGRHDEGMLTDREVFDRDDLERYEVEFRRIGH